MGIHRIMQLHSKIMTKSQSEALRGKKRQLSNFFKEERNVFTVVSHSNA